jgi:hypothetical protein
MAKHSVDTSKIQPAMGTLVTKASAQHRSLPEMPPSRGSAFAGTPPPSRVVAEDVPPYMTPEKARWTKAAVKSLDRQRRPR